jgi:hypothetical protein
MITMGVSLWITDFLPDQLTTEIQARVDRGAEVMKSTIEAEIRRANSNKNN